MNAYTLDRKARIASGVAALMLLLTPILLIGKGLHNYRDRNELPTSEQVLDDHLVRLKDGGTILLERGPFSQAILEWLQLDEGAATTVGIGASNFEPGSPDLSPVGLGRVAQIAQIMVGDPDVRAEIAVATEPSEAASAIALRKLRAGRINAELLRYRVPPTHIRLVTRPLPAAELSAVRDGRAEQSQLSVSFSR